MTYINLSYTPVTGFPQNLNENAENSCVLAPEFRTIQVSCQLVQRKLPVLTEF